MFAGEKKANPGPLANQNEIGMWLASHKIVMFLIILRLTEPFLQILVLVNFHWVQLELLELTSSTYISFLFVQLFLSGGLFDACNLNLLVAHFLKNSYLVFWSFEKLSKKLINPEVDEEPSMATGTSMIRSKNNTTERAKLRPLSKF